MIATSQRPEGAGLEKRLNILPAQPGSSDGKSPPTNRPTYQGPDGEDPLRYTVPLVPGKQPQLPYSSQGKALPSYNSRN